MIRHICRSFSFAAMLALLVSCSLVRHEEPQSITLVVTNGVLIDGTGTEPIRDGIVAIDGNRIVAASHTDDFNIPKDVQVIDAAGGSILPGIINAHSHKDMWAGTRQIMFLNDGVTSVCDMMIPIASMHYLDEDAAQTGPAARGFKAGPIITAPGGYPGAIFGRVFSYEIEGELEAETAVLDLVTQGADYIKVALEPGIFGDPWPVLSLEELRAIVKTAHAQGLLVRAHTNNAVLELALEAGVDVIEHVPMPSFSYEDLEPMFDDAGVFQMPTELEGQILRMVDQGIVLVPTLDVIIDDSYLLGDVASGEHAISQAVLDVVRFFHDSGGIIAVGNDYGNAGVKPGMPLREMKLLQIAGLSPLEVVEAATRHAAYVCGQGDQLGTIEVGKIADLIVVRGNPIDDFVALDSVLYVIKDGEVVVSPEQEYR